LLPCDEFYARYFFLQAQKKKFNGPTLGPKMSDSNIREFSDEQLRAGQSSLGLLNEGMSKGANQSGQNFGLSRHI
jgi:hypothetical protein